MNTEYQSLKNSFCRTIEFFRLKLLLYDLLNGIVITGFSFFFFLGTYVFLNWFFQFTVFWKSVFYYIFIFSLGVGMFYFIGYPLIKFFLSFFLANNILFNRIKKYIVSYPDVFVSIYYLAFRAEQISGDESLKRAAFVQKYKFLQTEGISLSFPDRLLFRNLVFVLLLGIFFIFRYQQVEKLYSDLSDYQNVQVKHELAFLLLNDNLNVEYGKGLKLKLKVGESDFEVENVFICYGGGEFLMSREDSLFIYEFQVINNDIQFIFKSLDQQSDFYKITVLPSPMISGYRVTATPPAYTGLKSEVLLNTVDFRVLYGTRLKFELNLADLDSLYLSRGEKMERISLSDVTLAKPVLNVRESGEYTFYGSNKHFDKKSLLNFTVTCIPDLYPGIQISEIQDSLLSSMHYFYGVITDDYGFSALRFNYSVNGRTNTVIPIPFVRHLNHQEFYFSFDFAEFAGMDRSEINYYFEVFDNDNLSGPKSSQTGSERYQVPDLNDIIEYNVRTAQVVNDDLNEAEKLAGEIVTGIKELQKKMLDNTADDWEKQQLSKDIIQKKEKLDQLLQSVRENNLKKTELNKNFTGQDSILLSKQKLIQDLLDQVMDEEMKNLMKEFSELSKQFSKDKFKNLDEKMKLSFDQLNEKLDRNIELLKRFQVEEKHDLITKQLEKLKSGQQKLDSLANENTIPKDSLSSLSKELSEKTETLRKNYEDLLRNNEQLSEPYNLNTLQPDFEKLVQDMVQQQKDKESGKKNKKLSEKIQQDIQELENKMKQQQQQNFKDDSLPENDIELIIQNLLLISLSQEEIMKEFPAVSSQSVRYNDLGKLQDLKRQEYKIVKDSLSVLANSNLMLASLLSHKFYDIEIKFGLLPAYIQDNKRNELSKEQQYIISYLNDIALVLTDALQKSQQSAKSGADGKKGSKSGKNGNKNSGKGQGENYQQMKDFQRNLKKQLEDLISQVKKGEKGKPLQQGISNTIRQNELFRKSLNDFMNEEGSMSNAEKQLLNEINKLIEDNIRDLANYSVSRQIINRNNLIYNKLIMSEKASKEREEFEEKRKSQSAAEIRYQKPETLFNTKKKSGFIKADFQKSDLKLKDYFRNIYNNYYIKLGNE